MTTHKVVKRVEFDGPVNFGYQLSGDGKQIYIAGTAPTIEVYDAETLQRQKVIDVNADITGGLLVVPSSVF